jgi:hypothetical protein
MEPKAPRRKKKYPKTEEILNYVPISAQNKKPHGNRVVDIEQLKKLCEINCTNVEISYILGVSQTALAQYQQIITEARSYGKASLKRRMWQAAMDEGSIPMMIFLAKNMLAYTDDPVKRIELQEKAITRISDEALEERFQAVIEMRKVSKEKESEPSGEN